MGWTEPAHTKSRVKQAGKTYVRPSSTPDEREEARIVINNWRSSHSFPLNTIQMNVRRKLETFPEDVLMAQRIKRLASIRAKLIRFPNMGLETMQDLGGCRVVLPSVDHVAQLVEIYRNRGWLHRLVREDDYIWQRPKSSGYRSVHIVFEYQGDKSTAWNGLKIELQVRSRLQHAWATAVETVGTFTRQALKSSAGDERWLQFFALMSAEFAYREGTAHVPGAPEEPDGRRSEIRTLARVLDVDRRLVAYGAMLRHVESQASETGERFFLLVLDPSAGVLTVRSYRRLDTATTAYGQLEGQAQAEGNQHDIVLVTIESLSSLRRAYPNYFADTSTFRHSLDEAISG